MDIGIKLCGLSREEDILAANECVPDFIGFVFAKSKRRVTAEQAKRLKRMLNPDIKVVGVCVDAPISEIEALLRDGTIDWVQLHGNEDTAYINALQDQIFCTVIKAVRVQSPEQILEAERLPADYLLLDTYVQGEAGGSGKSFAWDMIPKLSKRFFLAGGLNLGNVGDALRQCRPFAIDVSSGIETGGKKDPEKMKQLVRSVRRAASTENRQCK